MLSSGPGLRPIVAEDGTRAFLEQQLRFRTWTWRWWPTVSSHSHPARALLHVVQHTALSEKTGA
jgi:hypothetical protein